MHLIEVTKKFRTQEACLDYLAALRWPGETMVCMGCGVEAKKDQFLKFTTNETTRKRYSNKKKAFYTAKVPARQLYECKGCGYQFSATTGTVFHDSHLSLEKWFQAVAMVVDAKKGMSALQVCRHLGFDPGPDQKIPNEYKTIWYLCHRIREATKETGLLSGEVEADETYLYPKKPRRNNRRPKKEVVLGMIERGGRLRLVHVPDSKMEIIGPALQQHISPDVQTIYTDKGATYMIFIRRNFDGEHKAIDHRAAYGIGAVHTNTIESAFSLLKKGIYGTFHKVSIKHLPRYCNEFSYRFNRRKMQPQMFEETVKGLLNGKPLEYKKLTASEKAES